MMVKTALIQLCSGDVPEDNLDQTCALIRGAAADGARFVLTPEVTNCVSASRSHQDRVLRHEDQDPTLAALRDVARAQGIWVLIGSLALKSGDTDGRFANRSFLIGPDGGIVARYDKIHMFDVSVSAAETYRESDGFRPGAQAVVARTDFAAIGMSICYDLRFAGLYRRLAQAGAQILCVPAAFTRPTGQAHWEVLLRARAIETGSFVLAPAQCGTHPATAGKPRETYGHSMAVDPWGRVLARAGDTVGATLFDLDLSLVAKSRQRIPALEHDQTFELSRD